MSRTRQTIARLLAEGRSVAEIARATGLANNTVRYHRDRLRAGAGAARPPSPPPDPSRRQVRTRGSVAELLALGLPRAEVARRLGVSKATVSYHARRLGHDVDERCARRYDWAAVQRYYDAGHSVAECVTAFGFNRQTWHAAVNAGRIVPLDLHHVNGQRDDNRLENLQLLCPNCHALTESFGGRKGRRGLSEISQEATVASPANRERDGLTDERRPHVDDDDCA